MANEKVLFRETQKLISAKINPYRIIFIYITVPDIRISFQYLRPGGVLLIDT